VSFSKASKTSAKMHEIYINILKISESIDEKDCSKVEKSFEIIEENSKYLGKHFFLKNTGYKISFKNFKRVFSELNQVCNKKKNQDYQYVESLRQSVFASCFHCHSTDRVKIDNSFLKKGSDQIEDKIEQSLISRNYKQTEVLIDKFFENINYKAIDKILEIEQDLFLKILNEPKKLSKRYQKRSNIEAPYSVKQKTWSSELDKSVNIRKQDLLYTTADKFIEKRIGLFASEQKRIQLKYLIGRLSHFLHEAKEQEQARVLYYLGSLENRLDHAYYSVDNLYLIECLDKYPKDIYAKKCFNEFVDQVNFSFTGSKGIKIPESVQKMIKELNPTPSP
jgi:hypothetical protein